MRIGIDVSVLAMPAVAGRRHYLRCLLPRLLRFDAEWVLLHAAPREAMEAALPAEVHAARPLLVRLGDAARFFHRGAWAAPVPAPALPRDLDLDVFHAGEFYFPARLRGAAAVATVHDLTTLLLPDCHPAAGRLRDRRQLEWIRRHRARCLAVSAATAADLARLGGVADDRIHIVPEAAALDAAPEPIADVRARHGLGMDPFILHVGTLEPRKNLVRLIRAFEMLPPELGRWRLVLAGRRGWKFAPILKAAAASHTADRIHLLGEVPGATLAALYGGADVVACPSLYEGFGLPVLEAMSAGRAVLVSDRGALPEVAGDAAVVVDAARVDSMRDGLARLLASPGLREELGRKGRARARAYSWEQTAELTFQAYQRAAGVIPSGAPRSGAEPRDLLGTSVTHSGTSTRDLSTPRASPAPLEMTRGRKCVVLVTGHYCASRRKGGMHWIADAFWRAGWDVVFFTDSVSWPLWLRRRDHRLRYPLWREGNRLVRVRDRFTSYVWLTPWHPAHTGSRLLDRLSRPVFERYGELPLGPVEPLMRGADLFVFESTPGLLLVQRFRRLNPRARVVYRVSDDMRILGYHPVVPETEKRLAPGFDLLSIPSESVFQRLAHLPTARLHPPGLRRELFDHAGPTPYAGNGGVNLVFVGNSHFEYDFLGRASRLFPEWRFHIVGPIEGLPRRSNITAYGELPFEQTVPYLKHADIGLNIRAYDPGVECLANSLKVIQYTYCRLPIVAPEYLRSPRAHVFTYRPGDDGSIREALLGARACDRTRISTADILSWDDVVRRMIAEAGA